MIVPDINLLLYATVDGFSEHERARTWWEEVLNGDEDVGLAAVALFGFIRLATHPRVLDRPLAVGAAVDRVKEWLGCPQVRMLLPGPRHLEIAFQLFSKLGTGGNLTTDAQLAALAIEHQAELHSNDTDFARFDGLRWVNPLN